MTSVYVTATVACLIVAFMAWRLSQIHLKASKLCQCIADMCNAKDVRRAVEIAAATREELQREGLWKS